MNPDKPMKFILAFGNPFIESDSLALKIAEYFQKNPLKNHEFIKCIAPDEIMQYTDKEFYILDVAQGIKKITLINSSDQLEANNLVSLHDFDLGFFLKLAKEMNQLNKVNIICLPMTLNLKDAIEQIKEILKN